MSPVDGLEERRADPPTSAGSIEPAWGPRWTSENGVTVLLEESHVLPLVDVVIVVRSGALRDPAGKEGLARLSARMLRMGTRKLASEAVDEAVDAMGASLGVEVGHGTLRIHASVIRRSLEPLLTLIGKLVSEPALRQDDLGLIQREAVADLLEQRDNDRWLAGRAFRAHLFGAHPYARPAIGSEASIGRITRRDVGSFLEEHVVAGNVLIGVAGDVEQDALRPMIDRAFAKLRAGRVEEVPLDEPVVKPGRRVLIVDKPARTQTQMYLGTLGIRVADPEFYPLMVANTAFGGTFSSRLVREVRSERGWSYAAHSRLGADRQREAWSLYTHPSMENAADCAALELALIEKFVSEGLTAAELSSARDYLVKSHAFDRDTASKRLDPRLDSEIQHMPRSFYTDYVAHVTAVTQTGAGEAVRRRLSPRDLSIVLVATASGLKGRIEKLPGLADVAVVPFDRV